MRQAKESDIICLSMDIREGKRLVPYKGHDAQVFQKADLLDGMYFWADQIICSTNRTRQDINNYMRAYYGRGTEPEIGDKVICLRNSWDTLSDTLGNPLINGSIGYIEDMHMEEVPYKKRGQVIRVPTLITSLSTSSDTFTDVGIDYKALTTGEKTLSPQDEYYIRMNKANPELPIEFNYGYAITGHRAQGSQWNKVLVLEETFPFDRVEHSRWLYTACTRASDRLTLVLKS